MVEGGFGLGVAPFHGHAACQEDGGLIAGAGALELGDEDVAGVDGGGVVALVEGGVGGHEVALLDVGDVLAAFDKDAVLLDAFDALFDGAVHLGIDGAGVFVGAEGFDGEELRVVVDHGGVELLAAFLEAFVAVPPDVVVGGKVVVADIDPLGFLGGAGGEEEEEENGSERE